MDGNFHPAYYGHDAVVLVKNVKGSVDSLYIFHSQGTVCSFISVLKHYSHKCAVKCSSHFSTPKTLYIIHQ